MPREAFRELIDGLAIPRRRARVTAYCPFLTSRSAQKHQLLEESLLIYANDGGQGSTATEYDLDGEVEFVHDSGISTSNLGDVQRLPGGNTLVTYSMSKTIHEVDAAGDPVLEIHPTRSVGYTLWRETLYGPPADILL